MKMRVLALTLGVVFCGAASMLPLAEVYADGDELVAVTCPNGSARSSAPTYADCNIPATLPTKDVPTVAKTIINVITSVVGIVAVAVIVIGGVFYVISVGDSAKVKKAQNAIIYGVVGLVVSLLAYAIVNFVLKSVFS